MLVLVVAFFMGVMLGCVAGLLPGIHPNNTVPLVFALATVFEPTASVIILITSGIVNSFIAFIPSIMFGAPDDAEAMGVLPGHRMLMQGRGLEAIRLTVIGGFGGILLGVALLPLLALTVPTIYSFIRPVTHWLLLGAVTYLMLCEKSVKSAASAMLVFGLAGILGYLVLDIFVIQDGLLPLLSGLFGVSTLVVSLSENPKLPETVAEDGSHHSFWNIFPGVASGAAAGLLAGLLPGIGSSQAAMLVQSNKNQQNDASTERFLVALSSISAADVLYSLFALWLIGNPRSGIAVAVGQLITVSVNEILLICIVSIAAAAVGAILTLRLANSVLRWLRRIDYRKLCMWIIVGITATVAVLSGISGLVVLATSTGVGLLANRLDVRRSWAMGCLIVPTIIFFAGIS